MKETPIIFTYEDADGNEVEARLPVRIDLCDTCRGKGSRVNPAIDGNGLSREDFDADPDFEEAYHAGRYDIRCDDCDGAGRVCEPDWDKIENTPALRAAGAAYQASQREEAEYRRICAAERAAGC